MIRAIRSLVLLATCLCALAIGASYLGRWHGAGDSVAVFRFELSLLLLVGSAVLAGLGPRGGAVTGLVLALVAGGPIALGMARTGVAPDGPAVTLYQKNLLYLGLEQQAIIGDILAAAPDVVTLEEVSPANRPVVEALRGEYPSVTLCPFSGAGAGDVAVLSRYPMVDGSSVCAPGLAAMTVRRDDGTELTVAGLHLFWPWPYEQRAQVAEILGTLRDLDAPVLLAGDFNMVPWSWSLRSIGRASGSHRVGPVEKTIDRGSRLLRLRIDHVLAPDGWTGTVERRPRFGSDHYGLLATVGDEE
ncbi:endonuclease/exonuclease/phosphatase family protein [Pelagovum pacificum]|uniref:Endonuclease n=1 Tax=Pelagovum pacificum TaxID=2588711 RepID=A0A5C5GDL3_9RHOB|nr:endonuclease/exonuclease/phosphatase family protein [Pelagovum pacificum]QQA44288.1 endonuclease/exonuclease/phosphatase family protein [Pelagovum pacificum]TNY32590.1 endonuclease [Pelagovum pacificum]